MGNPSRPLRAGARPTTLFEVGFRNDVCIRAAQAFTSAHDTRSCVPQTQNMTEFMGRSDAQFKGREPGRDLNNPALGPAGPSVWGDLFDDAPTVADVRAPSSSFPPGDSLKHYDALLRSEGAVDLKLRWHHVLSPRCTRRDEKKQDESFHPFPAFFRRTTVGGLPLGGGGMISIWLPGFDARVLGASSSGSAFETTFEK